MEEKILGRRLERVEGGTTKWFSYLYPDTPWGVVCSLVKLDPSTLATDDVLEMLLENYGWVEDTING